MGFFINFNYNFKKYRHTIYISILVYIKNLLNSFFYFFNFFFKNPNKDFDLIINLDGESFFYFISDIIEFSKQDVYFFYDFTINYYILNINKTSNFYVK